MNGHRIFLQEKLDGLLQINGYAKIFACCPAMRKIGLRECVEKCPLFERCSLAAAGLTGLDFA